MLPYRVSIFSRNGLKASINESLLLGYRVDAVNDASLSGV